MTCRHFECCMIDRKSGCDGDGRRRDGEKDT